MNEQSWANFLGILSLDFLQKVVAPAMASQEGTEPDLNVIKGLSDTFQKLLLTKMKPMMAKASEEKKAEPAKEAPKDLGFEPVV